MAESEAGVCHKKTAEDGPSLFQNGNLVFQAHHVGWIVASLFTMIATVTSFWLVNKHLQWYTVKREQRHIVRILFLVPLYATISLASYFFWNHSTPLLLVRDGYESTVLTSFFYLLLIYLSPDPDEQRLIFIKAGLSRVQDEANRLKGEKLKRWVFPLGFIKWKPADGLYFLQLMKWGVLQYCVIRPTTTLAAVILDYMGLYCEESWGLGWGHIYITVIVSISVSVAMYCLIQLYVTVSDKLKPKRPLLKLFAIKAVVFLTFWQATALSVFTMFGIVKDTKYMTAADINIGIGALLETFEMTLFGFLHIKAFSYKPYRPFYDPRSKDPPPERTPRWKSLGHAMNFRETFRELWIGCVYLYDKMRHRNPRVDLSANRTSQFATAFGQARPSVVGPVDSEQELEKIPSSEYAKVHQDDPEQPNRWLGGGADYGYGIRREKSESLEVQIQKELEKRGYGSRIPGRGHIKPMYEEAARTHHQAQQSWWRSIYDRISQSSHDPDIPESQLGKRKSKSRSQRQDSGLRGVERGLLHEYQIDLDDPPPPSLMPITPPKADRTKIPTRSTEMGAYSNADERKHRHHRGSRHHRHQGERAHRHRSPRHNQHGGHTDSLTGLAISPTRHSHRRESALHTPESPSSPPPDASQPIHVQSDLINGLPLNSQYDEVSPTRRPLRRISHQIPPRDSQIGGSLGLDVESSRPSHRPHLMNRTLVQSPHSAAPNAPKYSIYTDITSPSQTESRYPGFPTTQYPRTVEYPYLPPV